jgi:hypothetical protein
LIAGSALVTVIVGLPLPISNVMLSCSAVAFAALIASRKVQPPAFGVQLPSSVSSVELTTKLTKESSFLMVRVAVDWKPSAPPKVGLLKVRLIVSCCSGTVSAAIVIVKVFDVSPSAKQSWPLAGV